VIAKSVWLLDYGLDNRREVAGLSAGNTVIQIARTGSRSALAPAQVVPGTVFPGSKAAKA
jgi:hypothetical protein